MRKLSSGAAQYGLLLKLAGAAVLVALLLSGVIRWPGGDSRDNALQDNARNAGLRLFAKEVPIPSDLDAIFKDLSNLAEPKNDWRFVHRLSFAPDDCALQITYSAGKTGSYNRLCEVNLPIGLLGRPVRIDAGVVRFYIQGYAKDKHRPCNVYKNSRRKTGFDLAFSSREQADRGLELLKAVHVPKACEG